MLSAGASQGHCGPNEFLLPSLACLHRKSSWSQGSWLAHHSQPGADSVSRDTKVVSLHP